MTVLVVGEALVDVVRRTGEDDSEHAGGSPFNVAVGLARLGVPALLATQVGDDQHGDLLRRHLDASGAALLPLEPTPSRTSTAVATPDDTGAATYDFDLCWDPEALPAPDGFDAVHVGSIGTWLEPGATLVAALARRAAAAGIPVTYDANVRTSIEPDAQAWRQAAALVIPSAAIVKMSDEDAAVLFPGRTPRRVAEELAAPERLVVVTCGADGAVLGRGDLVEHVDAPTATVADTIGAGDSFMAALVAWLVEHDWTTPDAPSLVELGRFAATAAAITVSRPGADPPWRHELAPD